VLVYTRSKLEMRLGSSRQRIDLLCFQETQFFLEFSCSMPLRSQAMGPCALGSNDGVKTSVQSFHLEVSHSVRLSNLHCFLDFTCFGC